MTSLLAPKFTRIGAPTEGGLTALQWLLNREYCIKTESMGPKTPMPKCSKGHAGCSCAITEGGPCSKAMKVANDAFRKAKGAHTAKRRAQAKAAKAS